MLNLIARDLFALPSLLAKELDVQRNAYFQLAINVEDKETEYLVYANLPGVKPEHVNIEFKDDILDISVKFQEDKQVKNNFVIQEFHSNYSASRKLKVPGVDANKIDAHFENGVLSIKLPKKEQVLAKKITIKVNAPEVIENKSE